MKREKRLLVLLLVVLGIINISLFRKGHPNASDHAAYLIQTKSIVEGSVEKYSEMANFRKNNSIVIISPALYPWGFPLLLSPIYAIWGMNLFAHKTFIYIFFLVSCYFIYLLFKNKLNTKYIFSIIILICFNPYFFFFKDWIVSDIPHMMFALMSMYLIDRFVIQKKFIVNIYISYLILGLVLFWTYYIRKQGLVLIPYLLTIQIIEYLREDVKIKMNIKKVFQESIPLVTFFIINLFSAYILFAVGRSDYSNAFEIEIIKHNIIPNIIYYLTLPVGEFNVSFDYILPLYVVVVIDIVYILFVIIIFYGMLIRGKRDYLFAIFIVYNIVLLIIFPYKGGLRFLFPIIPFCLYFFYLGLLNIHQVFFIRKLLTIDKSFTLVRKINVLMVKSIKNEERYNYGQYK